MALKIGVVSQKGGVGKSTVARVIACEYAGNGWEVKIADMDKGQTTVGRWHARRLARGFEPEISVEQYSRVDRALRIEDRFDLLVFDGAPHATLTTKEIAKVADLIVVPSGVSLDDLEPTVLLAHDFRAAGISPDIIAIALCRVGDSVAELEEARAYIDKAGYPALEGSIPERTAYRRASDIGLCITETRYRSLNDRAAELVQSIIDRVAVLEEV